MYERLLRDWAEIKFIIDAEVKLNQIRREMSVKVIEKKENQKKRQWKENHIEREVDRECVKGKVKKKPKNKNKE